MRELLLFTVPDPAAWLLFIIGAVTVTPQDILNWAYGKSKRNVPGTIATESDELRNLVGRALRGLYALAARVNPTFFATTSTVAIASSAWARPEDAESVFRIEAAAASPPTSITSGTEIVVVPFDQRTVEPGKPAVYRYGQAYRPVSASATVEPISPQNGSLTFFYSKRPAIPATLSTVLDSQWVEAYNELLALETAIYLAIKDKRGDELPELKAQRDAWVKLYIAFLEHEHVGERRAYGHIARFNTHTRVPLVSLLAGGDAVASEV